MTMQIVKEPNCKWCIIFANERFYGRAFHWHVVVCVANQTLFTPLKLGQRAVKTFCNNDYFIAFCTALIAQRYIPAPLFCRPLDCSLIL